MAKNVKRFFQAWELKQQGLTCKEIGQKMGFSLGRASQLVRFVNKWAQNKRKPQKLRDLMNKYGIKKSRTKNT